MTENKAAFRTAMSGYNKKDVTQYIASLSQNFEEKSREYEATIANLRAKIDELESAAAASAATTSTSGEELAQARASLDQANAIIDAQKQQLDNITAELDDLRGKHSQASAKLATLTDAEAKLAEYEQLKVKMGELYLDAASNADRIKAEAESYAVSRRAEADAELIALREANYTKLKETFSGISGELLTVIERYRAKAAAADELSAEDIL